MSLESTISRNRETIKSAFDRLKKDSDDIFRAGLVALLPAAMEFAISSHDHSHFGHRITRNSYGWAVAHDGKVTDISVNEGNHGHGDATSQMSELASRLGPGWVGIVLASMTVENEKGKTIALQIEYEEDLLGITIDEIKGNFNKYFKAI